MPANDYMNQWLLIEEVLQEINWSAPLKKPAMALRRSLVFERVQKQHEIHSPIVLDMNWLVMKDQGKVSPPRLS